jgi:hypothetical protein
MHSQQYRDRRLLSTREAATQLNLGESTLEKDRLTGRLGIPYVKLGKRVAYDPTVLDEWITKCRRASTSEPAAKPPKAIPSSPSGEADQA